MGAEGAPNAAVQRQGRWKNGDMAALYIGVVVLYAARVIIGIWTVFNGQITVGLGLIAMCGFLLWTFVYLPADMARSWSRNCWS